MTPPLSAALLAGGKSSRMGRDKCLLEIDGLPLWKRQLDLLAALTDDVMIVSPAPPAWLPESAARWIPDAVIGCGPLGGLAAALDAAANDLVLVLAVDLPAMTADFLRRLVASTPPGRGAVPEIDGLYQPLSAIYPRDALPLVRRHLGEPDKSLQRLIRALIAEDLMQALPVVDGDRPRFRNFNGPED